MRTLIILAVVSIIAYTWAENSRVVIRTPRYEEKLAASQWMNEAMLSLRDAQDKRGALLDMKSDTKADTLDLINDPNETALIGQQYTKITTDIGDLEAKLTALNPNMAAVFVDYFSQAGLQEGDVVAVGMTGSLPGMNLAFYGACQTMRLNPIVITSVGASSWGANDPKFTWIDMEHHLMIDGLLNVRSIASSIGGGGDIGRRLSPEGRDLIRESALRNDVRLIEESLESSIQTRMDIYEDHADGDPIKLYVNIGGGLASIGSSQNSGLIPVGYNPVLPMLNYPARGVIHEFAGQNIAVLQVSNIREIALQYDLSKELTPLPTPGKGSIFSEERYNMAVSISALALVFITLAIVLFYDRRTQRLDRPGVDPDTLI